MQVSVKEIKRRARDGGQLVFVGDDGAQYHVDVEDIEDLPAGRIVLEPNTENEIFAPIKGKRAAVSPDPNMAAARAVEAAIGGYKELVRAQQDMIDRQVKVVEQLTALNQTLLGRVNEDGWTQVVEAVGPHIPLLVPVVEQVLGGLSAALAHVAAAKKKELP